MAPAGQVATAGVYGTVSGGAVISGDVGSAFHVAVPLQTASISLSMAVNTLVTGLIASKIWVQSGQISVIREGGKNDRTFNRAMTLVIESGLMNFVVQLLYLVLNALELPAFSLMETCTVHFYVRHSIWDILIELIRTSKCRASLQPFLAFGLSLESLSRATYRPLVALPLLREQREGLLHPSRWGNSLRADYLSLQARRQQLSGRRLHRSEIRRIHIHSLGLPFM